MTTLIFALFILGTIGFVIGVIVMLDRHARRMHGRVGAARHSSDGGIFVYADGGSSDTGSGDCSPGSDGGGCGGDGGGGGD